MWGDECLLHYQLWHELKVVGWTDRDNEYRSSFGNEYQTGEVDSLGQRGESGRLEVWTTEYGEGR